MPMIQLLSAVEQVARRLREELQQERWSGLMPGVDRLAVDLGAMKKISRVCINWETAHAKAFTIQVSPDGQTWTEVYKNDAGQGGINDIRIDPASTRWVRMLGSKRATEWGYAIRELQVFE